MCVCGVGGGYCGIFYVYVGFVPFVCGSRILKFDIFREFKKKQTIFFFFRGGGGMKIFVDIYIVNQLSRFYIYSESTEPIDAVNILPLARFEPTTSATPPSTTPDTDATNCATETSPKKDVQEALILTTTDAVHVVYWFFFNGWHLFRSQVKA